jgi:ABC-type antimicrobial peptide transport system permease subunit
MRSVLTTLGIIIGIAAVIAMMEIGNGVKLQMQKSMAALGANNLMVWPGSTRTGGVSSGSGGRVNLTDADCKAIVESCPAVKIAAPLLNGPDSIVIADDGTNYKVSNIVGSSPEYLEVREWPVEEGEPFTERDLQTNAKVCLIGKTLVRELFHGRDPIGRELRLDKVGLKVVGVLSTKGANMFGRDQDETLLVPWTTMKHRIFSGGGSSSSGGSSSGSTSTNVGALYPTGGGKMYPDVNTVQQADNPMPVRFENISQITIAALNSESIQPAMEQITELLRERHRIRPGEPDDFNIRDMTEMANTFNQQSNLMTTLLLIVAAISLVVGGVGIMNIMLVSVTERTREIGLRMAVGARSRDILVQFLIEATLLCLAGGIVGIALGRVTSYIVRQTLDWATAPSIPAILISFAVSALVGVGFGFYPAWKASRLDPIDALRYE